MSEIKVNKISPRSGTDVTLGDSGDTFTIPSGATITNSGTAVNFGATGSASWTTTVKTNSDSGFTATAGEGYFLNTTAGTISVNLPAGSAGAVVAFKDYAGTFQTNNVTVVPNGSDKIGGSTTNATLSTKGIAVTLIFIDSTQGWLVTDDGVQSSADNNPYIVATGGTETESGNCKIHTFTGPGTFSVTKTATAAADNVVSHLVVAGGGGTAGAAAGESGSGGGGAGGYREVVSPSSPYTGSPLNGYPSAPNRITVTATNFPITIGAGGAAGPTTGIASDGGASIFSTITSAGGGGSAAKNQTARPGGSGAGGVANPDSPAPGNNPPTSPAQGTPGGPTGSTDNGGGGGGATAPGGSGTPGDGGDGGAGGTSSINGTPTARAGGGAGGAYNGNGGSGGAGGGGDGAHDADGTAGTVNTGGGAGGTGSNSPTVGNGAQGGSGIVIIRYRFQ